MKCCCQNKEVVDKDIGRVLADRCEAENRYPAEVARDFLIANPFAGTHFYLSELINYCDCAMVKNESED